MKNLKKQNKELQGSDRNFDCTSGCRTACLKQQPMKNLCSLQNPLTFALIFPLFCGPATSSAGAMHIQRYGAFCWMLEWDGLIVQFNFSLSLSCFRRFTTEGRIDPYCLMLASGDYHHCPNYDVLQCSQVCYVLHRKCVNDKFLIQRVYS